MQSNFGVWITANDISQKLIDAIGLDIIIGGRTRFPWSAIETEPDVFNFAPLDSSATVCKNNGLKFMAQDFADQNCPEWLYAPPFSVPKIFTDNQGFNVFPHVVNLSYQTRLRIFTKALSDHFKSRPDIYSPDFLAAWFPSDGSTGDPGWIKGSPIKVTINDEEVPQSDINVYDVSDDLWTQTKYLYWEYIASLGNSAPIALNPDNAARYFDKAISLGVSILKSGDLGHQYGLDCELADQERGNAFPDFTFFSEFEFTDGLGWWTEQDFLPIVCESLAGNMRWLTVHYDVTDMQKESLRFYNAYASGKGGFIYPRTSIDYSDSIFPEEVYGPVIDPARSTAYINAVKRNIESANGYWVKEEIDFRLIQRFINPARKKMIQDEFIAKGALLIEENYGNSDGSIDLHNNDFGICLFSGDYELRMHHIEPFRYCIPAWRVGDPSKRFGRYAWVIDAAIPGKDKSYVMISNSLDDPNIQNENVILAITYLDKDFPEFKVGKWSYKRSSISFPFDVVGGDTGEWKRVEFEVRNFRYEHKLDLGSDFIIAAKKGRVIIGQYDFK